MQNTPIVLGFTAGELSPWLSTRFDLQAYQRGAAKLQNFMVQPYGGVRRRYGTAFVGAAAVQDADAIRLFSFRYSEADTLLLEFFPSGMRVYRAGELLQKDGVPYVLALPWTSAEMIASLRFMQVNDAVYATCPTHPPVGIYRYGDTDWRCRELVFNPYPRETYAEQDVALHVSMESGGQYAKVEVGPSGPTLSADMAGREVILAEAQVPERTLFQSVNFVSGASALPDLSSVSTPSEKYYYIKAQGTGWYEFYTCHSRYYPANCNGSLSPADYPDCFLPGIMRLDENGQPYEVVGDWEIHTHGEWNALWELWRSYDTTNFSYNYLRWRWTRIRSFGQDAFSERKNWSISGSEERPCRMVLVCRSAKDLTVAPMLYFRILGGMREYKMRVESVSDERTGRVRILSPYLGGVKNFDTCRWSFGAFGPRNGYPRFSGLHQGRLWFGGTPGQGTTLFASATDDFQNFYVGSNDDDALHLTLSTDDQSRVCWICPARSLLVGTSASEWTLSAPDGGAVTASNATFTRQSSVGSEGQAAHSVENTVFYVQRGGKRLREISFKLEADGFTSTDTSLLAEHLFASGVKEWAVQRGCSTRLWVLMHDGTLGVLTTNVAQQVTAWQRAVFQGRRVCHLASLTQEGSSEDELWLVLQHEQNGYVSLERMVESNPCLDGTGQVTPPENGRFGAGMQVAGLRGVVFAGNEPNVVETVEFAADGSFRLPEDSPLAAPGTALCYGIPYESSLQTMPLEREASFNAVQQLGRVKLRLLESDPAFEFRASHASRWERYEPGRGGEAYPFSGAIRISQIPAPGVGQGVCLRYSGVRDFCLLSLTVDVDFHGR